jgi:hypothetical protein
MRRLAIFVEGLTEELFAERFLTEVIGSRGLGIEKLRASGGKVARRTFTRITSPSGSSPAQFYALIINCGTDNRVKSDIRENYDNLVAKGYRTIIGMRDAYPDTKSLAEVPKLRKWLPYKIKTKPCEVTFVLGVMEIEAWFIAEHTHFERISNKLTLGRIKRAMGFDPSKADLQRRPRPASDLDAIYRLAKIRYRKEEASIRRTVNSLDFTEVYLELGNRFEDLRLFIAKIDKLLPAAAQT